MKKMATDAKRVYVITFWKQTILACSIISSLASLGYIYLVALFMKEVSLSNVPFVTLDLLKTLILSVLLVYLVLKLHGTLT